MVNDMFKIHQSLDSWRGRVKASPFPSLESKKVKAEIEISLRLSAESRREILSQREKKGFRFLYLTQIAVSCSVRTKGRMRQMQEEIRRKLKS